MSDFPNGRPPGQNNLDATSPAYVLAENDPSAGAQKPDADRPKEDGIEVREDDTDEETKQELVEARKNIVEPSTAEAQEPAPRASQQRTQPDAQKPTDKK